LGDGTKENVVVPTTAKRHPLKVGTKSTFAKVTADKSVDKQWGAVVGEPANKLAG